MHLDRLCLDDDRHGGEPRTPAPTTGPQPLSREPDCRADQAEGWLTTWAAGFTPVSAQFGPSQAGFADQTLRQVVHTSVGGGAVRLRLSNTYGDRPLHVGRATVAVATEPAGGRAHVQPLSARPLTFGGAAAVVVPPGGDVLSDAVTLPVPPDHDLAVSLWFPEPTGPPSGHLVALETSYVGAGDLVDDWGPGFAGARPIRSAFYVSAVDVLAEDPAGTVVLLGDSLTDGAGGHDDAEARWPDVVVDRLSGAGPLRLGVANVGIAGNPLLPGRGSTSASALERFDHDVLAHADVSTVMVLLGTNDLVGRGSTGAAIVEGLRQMVARGHAAGLRVIGATIPPLAGPQDPPTPAALELARTQVNRQVLDGGLGFDGVVDMDAALRDPADPTRVLGRYAWFGGLHPDDEGHRAMGRAVDLALLDPASLPPAPPAPAPPPG
jgi:lysophospholipase L1-like esterase